MENFELIKTLISKINLSNGLQIEDTLEALTDKQFVKDVLRCDPVLFELDVALFAVEMRKFQNQVRAHLLALYEDEIAITGDWSSERLTVIYQYDNATFDLFFFVGGGGLRHCRVTGPADEFYEEFEAKTPEEIAIKAKNLFDTAWME